MLLDIGLTEDPPKMSYEDIFGDCVFVGCHINNLYDEQRVHLNNINGIEPKRYRFNKVHNLYGFKFEPKGEDRILINQIKDQNSIDLYSYNLILDKYNYKSGESFAKLHFNMFPLDQVHIERYIPGYLYEDFISFDDELAAFQQFTSINMYILINGKRI